MARQMAANDTELFRAIVEVTYTDTAPEEGAETTVRTMTEVLGPYRTKGAAMAAIKRADREAEWYKRHFDSTTTVGRIERAATVWEPVQ